MYLLLFNVWKLTTNYQHAEYILSNPHPLYSGRIERPNIVYNVYMVFRCKGDNPLMNQTLRFTLLPLIILAVLLCLSITAMMGVASEHAWAQERGTIPPGTIPGGTIPPPTVIYLGFKTSDEIEYPDDTRPDLVYKNEDVIAFDPATGLFTIIFDGSVCGLADANLDDFDLLPNGNLIFTLRTQFTIPGLGEVDDSDVIEYTPDPAGCGTFTLRLRGSDVGLTRGAEDIDALGIAADGNLLISTIGTARVPSATGELQVRDQALIKLDESTGFWALYFDGTDVELINSSEDIRSVWEDPNLDTAGYQHLFLTLSGDFRVESDNSDEGDKNDVEGCALLQSGETTECFFFKLLDGKPTGAENQLDGLAIVFPAQNIPVRAMTGRDADGNNDETAIEAARDFADFMAALAEGDDEVTIDDFLDIVTQLYFPIIRQ